MMELKFLHLITTKIYIYLMQYRHNLVILLINMKVIGTMLLVYIIVWYILQELNENLHLLYFIFHSEGS